MDWRRLGGHLPWLVALPGAVASATAFLRLLPSATFRRSCSVHRRDGLLELDDGCFDGEDCSVRPCPGLGGERRLLCLFLPS